MQSPTALLQFSSSSRVPLIHQTAMAECGLACLAMVANYHGFRTDLNTLRSRFPVSLKGATLKGVMETADRLNLASRPLKVSLEQLSELQTPAILHWDMSHFVVLAGFQGRKAIIHDPGHGRRVLDLETVSKHFTGIALELTPTAGFEKQDERRSMRLTDFWSRISGFKGAIIQVLLLSIALQIFALGGPFYMQLVVDEALISNDRNLLVVLAIGFLMLLVIEVSTGMIRSWVVLMFSSLLNVQMANNLFRHLIRLPMNYYENRHIGDTVSRFQSMHEIKDMLTTGFVEALVDGLMSIILVALLFVYSPRLALVVLIFVALYLILRLLLFRPYRNLTEESIIAGAREQSNFMETVRGIQSIKLFGKEVDRQGLWQNRYAEVVNTNIRLGKFKIGFTTINGLLMGIENILVIYLGAVLVLDSASAFTVGMLYAFVSYKRQFTSKADALISMLIQFRMLKLHLERIADIAKTPTEEHLDQDGGDTLPISGTLNLQNIGYRYSPEDPYLFKNLNLKVEQGEVIAIIGPSGTGKTTLLKVMLGLLVPEEGAVTVEMARLPHQSPQSATGSPLSTEDLAEKRRAFIDQKMGTPPAPDRPKGADEYRDIHRLGLRQYRSQIAAVMQEDQLLSGTISDNICFFDHQPDQARVEQCARLACLHNDIQAMPMGYNSLVGDMGTTLSGGQKQRLLLARALYREPKILFLDEASSHLDVQTEQQINHHLRQLPMTRIMIAHRQATIEMADRVVALHGGQLHELPRS